jgi:hypothetical protein
MVLSEPECFRSRRKEEKAFSRRVRAAHISSNDGQTLLILAECLSAEEGREDYFAELRLHAGKVRQKPKILLWSSLAES